MKQHKKLLLSLLAVLVFLAALLLIFEIPYGFRLLRKTSLSDLVESPAENLLQGYDTQSREIADLPKLQKELDTLSDDLFCAAPFHLLAFLGSERGMSLDYPEGTLIIGEHYLAFLRKNKKGLIRGLPAVYRPEGAPALAEMRSLLLEFPPENQSNTDETGAALPPEIPSDLPATRFSVLTEAVPESAARYAEEKGRVILDLQLSLSEWNGAPYNPEEPYRIGAGFYGYHLSGLRLSRTDSVSFPALQNGHVLCFLRLTARSGGQYAMSADPENIRRINAQDLTDGVIVYDKSGDCFYVTEDRAVLLDLGALSFRPGANLCRIAKMRANGPEAVRRMLKKGTVILVGKN